jgi:hypothetical protein
MEAGGLKVLAVAALLGGFGLLGSAARRYRLRRQVGDTPTARVRSVAMGRAEFKGLAESEPPQVAPFSGRPCCWWRVSVEEERRVLVRNGARREWCQIHSASSEVPFWLNDAGARIGVLPQGAEVDAPCLLDYTSGIFRMGGAPSGPGAAVWLYGAFSGRRRRLREWRIDVKRPLYVLGVVRPFPGLGAAVGRGRAGEPFLISTRDETEILRSLQRDLFLRLAGALLLFLGCLAALLHLH